MSKENKIEPEKALYRSLLHKFQIENLKMILLTLIYSFIGIGIFLLIALIPMPYTVFSVFTFGLAPTTAIITLLGAIRGPIAGFLTGYLGTLFKDLLFYSTIVQMTLPNLAYGIMGVIVGLSTYELSNGRSLIKLSILSVIGFILTVVIVGISGIIFEEISTLVETAFVVLPLLTVGIPSVILLTPLFARLWHLIISKVSPSTRVQY